MIDLHCHILPALDDGALDLEDSIAMARQADADGIELICATPHIRHDHAVRIDELADRVAEVNGELATRGIGVRITTGGEVAEDMLRALSEPDCDRVSLGGGRRWVLVEPAPGPLSPGLVSLATELAGNGRGLLIAHPERHLDGHSVERLEAAVARGARVQATAAAVASAEGGPLVELAMRGLIHVLGSDAHSSHGGRPVALRSGLARLSRIGALAEHADWIEAVAPAAVVRGDEVAPPFGPTSSVQDT